MQFLGRWRYLILRNFLEDTVFCKMVINLGEGSSGVVESDLYAITAKSCLNYAFMNASQETLYQCWA